MSLTVELFDRPERGPSEGAPWTICSLDEIVDLRLTWRCPSSQLLQPHDRSDADQLDPFGRLRYAWPYVAQAAAGELQSKVKLHREQTGHEGSAAKSAPAQDATSDSKPAEADDDDNDNRIETWTGLASIRAPKFWPMTIRVIVDGPGRDSQPVTVRLIPRLSVLVSGFLVVASLIMLPIFGAFTLKSLSLTLDETVAGISGLTLIGMTLVFARAIGKRSWPHSLPYLGIPYLLPRALAAVVCGIAALLLVLANFTVTIHNGTSRTVKIALPARDSDDLLPDAWLTYARPRVELESALARSHGQEFCVFDRWAEDQADQVACLEPKHEVGLRWWQRYLAPPIVELRCKRRFWKGVSYSELAKLDADLIIERREDTGDGAVELRVTDACELPDGLIGEIRIDDIDGEGNVLEGRYIASYPWTLTQADNHSLTVLGVDDASPDTTLEVIAADQRRPLRSEVLASSSGSTASETGNDSNERFQPGSLLGTRIRIRSSARGMTGVFVPAQRKDRYLQVKIGSHDTSGSVLSCQSERSQQDDTHFRAVHLPVGGDREAIELIRAASSQTGGWTSDWRGNMTMHSQGWLCAVVAGRTSPAEKKPVDFAVDTLTLVIDENRLEDSVRLSVPREWMAKQIWIRSTLEKPTLGTLSCQPSSSMSASTITIGTLRNVGWPKSGKLDALEIKTGVVSSWEAGEGNASRWAWACWEEEGQREVTARARVGTSTHPASVKLGSGQLEVERPPLSLCWLAEDDGSFGLGSPPDGSEACNPTASSRRRKILAARGIHDCDQLFICSSTPKERR